MEIELPLAGLKVLDFTWVMAGPAATRYLADYGATVVKVESATKIETGRTLGPAWQGKPDPETSAFMADNNAGKLGMTLNIRTEAGQALARRLVQWADVVAEAFTPKVMRSCGLDFAALQRINPGIIMLSTSLNGLTGPYSQVAGYGTLGAALAGFAPFVEWPDRPPAGPFSAYTDYVAPKFAVAALMAALEHRRLTGEGQHIDMAQSEASIHFLGEAVLEYTANGRVWPPAGNSDRLLCPNGAYPAAGPGNPSRAADRHGRAGDHLQSQASQTTNDRWVALSVGSEQQWQALARLAGPPLADDPRFATAESRRQHEAELDAAIAAWTATQPPRELEAALQAAGVPAHEVVTIAGAFEEPQLQARNHFIKVAHPVLGECVIENSRTKMPGTPAQITQANATLGEHTDYVLRELLGLSDDEIIEAVASGAVE